MLFRSYVVRCPIIINNIVKVKAVCKTTFWEESKNMVVDSKGSKSYSMTVFIAKKTGFGAEVGALKFV